MEDSDLTGEQPSFSDACPDCGSTKDRKCGPECPANQ